MGDKIVFGQYVFRDSIVHKLDSRTKLLILILSMIAVFLVPQDNFIMLAIVGLIPLIGVALSKVSLMKYLKSLKQIVFIMMFSFVFQLILNKEGSIVVSATMNLTVVNLIVVSAIAILYFVLRKYLPLKLLILILVVVGCIYILNYPLYGNVFKTITWDIYQGGLIHGLFIFARVFVVIMASSVLTLTTKPTDLTNAIEWYLKPLEALGIKTSIFAMMISIALRFIPTLFNETNKILKAQASRGVDFNEGRLTEQVKQIVSLLVPMFVISIKRATDLADAMEARGYVPGAPRTKLAPMKFYVKDYVTITVAIILFVAIVLGKCGVYAL